jgi:hypothetical protein
VNPADERLPVAGVIHKIDRALAEPAHTRAGMACQPNAKVLSEAAGLCGSPSREPVAVYAISVAAAVAAGRAVSVAGVGRSGLLSPHRSRHVDVDELDPAGGEGAARQMRSHPGGGTPAHPGRRPRAAGRGPGPAGPGPR